MDKLSSLYGYAFARDINIVNAHFSETKKAACLHRRPYKNILIDKSLIDSPSEEGSILSEEIGHYETGGLYVIESTYNTPIARNNRIKYEAKARHWAYKYYLSSDEIQRGINYGGCDKYLIAEYCQVPIDFLDNALSYYASMGIKFDYCECE